jgi:hypothetical protein
MIRENENGLLADFFELEDAATRGSALKNRRLSASKGQRAETSRNTAQRPAPRMLKMGEDVLHRRPPVDAGMWNRPILDEMLTQSLKLKRLVAVFR